MFAPSQMHHQLRVVRLSVQRAVLHSMPGLWQLCQDIFELGHNLVAMLRLSVGNKSRCQVQLGQPVHLGQAEWCDELYNYCSLRELYHFCL